MPGKSLRDALRAQVNREIIRALQAGDVGLARRLGAKTFDDVHGYDDMTEYLDGPVIAWDHYVLTGDASELRRFGVKP